MLKDGHGRRLHCKCPLADECQSGYAMHMMKTGARHTAGTGADDGHCK